MAKRQSSCTDIEINVNTEIRENVFTFNWTINNLSKLPKEEGIKSPTFRLNSTHELYGLFELYEKGYARFLFYLISGPDIIIKHDFSIVNNNGRVLYNRKLTDTFDIHCPINVLVNDGHLVKSAILEAVKENILNVKCVLEFNEICHDSIRPFVASPLDDMPSLSRDLKSLYEAPLYTDIILRVGDCKMPAHKNILSARSTVFAKMFLLTPMEENEKNVVDIPDLDSATIKGLLSYLYTAVLPSNDFESVCTLYYAGDKYGVPSLCAACRRVILGKMDAQNVSCVLSIAERHSDTEFKDQAMRFIEIHFEEVHKTESWLELVRDAPGLSTEVLTAFCVRSSKKIKTQE